MSEQESSNHWGSREEVRETIERLQAHTLSSQLPEQERDTIRRQLELRRLQQRHQRRVRPLPSADLPFSFPQHQSAVPTAVAMEAALQKLSQDLGIPLHLLHQPEQPPSRRARLRHRLRSLLRRLTRR